jgi:hypothetical protein
MLGRTWFIGFEGPARSAAPAHLDRIHAARPGSVRTAISLAKGRQFTAVTAPGGAIEGVRFWCTEAGRVHAWTDRLNFSPIFHAQAGDQHIFASEVSLFPAELLAPDPGAVAALALNGSCLAGRTLYKEVAALRRASAHTLEAGELQGSA